MGNDKPTLNDFLFRDGQAFFGSQQGKANEMLHDALEQEKKQTELLRDMVAKQREAAALARYQDPISLKTEYISPDYDIYGLTSQLNSEFQNLAESQKELSTQVEDLGYYGQMALQEARGHTALLNRLDSRAVDAFQQRNLALQGAAAAIIEQRRSNQQLSGINREIFDVRQSVEKGTHGLCRGLNDVREGIDQNTLGARRSIGLSTAILSSDLESLQESLVASLGDIGVDISGLTDEVIRTRLQVIQTLQDSQAIFLWSHREQIWVKKQILDVLRNPRRTAGYEAWQIGEQCRLAGDQKQAAMLFEESLKNNPTEARNYISLGLMCIEKGHPDQGKNYFANAIRYSTDPQIKGTAYMYLAKLEMFDLNFSQSKTLLGLARDTDVTNLEVWFDLAICEMRLGDRREALYYIQNLLYAPTVVPKKTANVAAQYALKIIAEPVFSDLMPEIRKIMKEIIHKAQRYGQ